MYHHGNWTYPIWHKQQRWSFHYSTRFHLPHHHCTHVLQTHHETQGDRHHIHDTHFHLSNAAQLSVCYIQWHVITTKMDKKLIHISLVPRPRWRRETAWYRLLCMRDHSLGICLRLEIVGSITFMILTCTYSVCYIQWHVNTTKMHLRSMWTRNWSTYTSIRYRPWIVFDLK